MKSRIDKTEYRVDKYPSGNKYWFKNNNYHRDNDKPAIIYSNGTMSWWESGELIKRKLKNEI
jgi:hypothetical protein